MPSNAFRRPALYSNWARLPSRLPHFPSFGIRRWFEFCASNLSCSSASLTTRQSYFDSITFFHIILSASSSPLPWGAPFTLPFTRFPILILHPICGHFPFVHFQTAFQVRFSTSPPSTLLDCQPDIFWHTFRDFLQSRIGNISIQKTTVPVPDYSPVCNPDPCQPQITIPILSLSQPLNRQQSEFATDDLHSDLICYRVVSCIGTGAPSTASIVDDASCPSILC